MNGWALLFFALVIGVLILYIFVDRNYPEQADRIADAADGWWQRLRAKLRR